MLKRTISGAVYVAIIVGFFLLRNIHNSFFDIFVWFLSFMGAFEVARAVKPFTLKGTFILALIFGATFTPSHRNQCRSVGVVLPEVVAGRHPTPEPHQSSCDTPPLW